MNYVKIISGALFRAGGAISLFLLNVLVSRTLGAEGKGALSLFILQATIIQLFSFVISGSPVSFFAPKLDNVKLLLAAGVWNIFISCVATAVVFFFAENTDTLFYLFLFILGNTLLQTNQQFLLGKKNISWFNLLQFVPVFTIYAIIVAVNETLGSIAFDDVAWSYIAGYFSWFLISLIPVLQSDFLNGKTALRTVFSEMLSYGKLAQLSNAFQLLAYRITFYMLAWYHSEKDVGIYSNAVAIAESVWIISRSGSSVLFSEIINSNSDVHNRQLTMKWLVRISLATFPALIALLVFPDSFYIWLFGRDFVGLHDIVVFLVPGVGALAASNIIVHYFSASGAVKMSTVSSAISMLAVTVSGFWLIPVWGNTGAAAATSMAFILSACYLLLSFFRPRRA